MSHAAISYFWNLRYRYGNPECTLSEILTNYGLQPHSMHATYLHFYAAVSSELVARSAPNLSAAKVSLLERAKESYLEAVSSLPEPVLSVPDLVDHHSDDSSDNTSESSGPPSRPSTPCPNRTSILTYPSSPSSVESAEDSLYKVQDILKPSPLRISKVQRLGSISDTPTTPRPTRPTSVASAKSITFAVSTSAWLEKRPLDRYNAHLVSFAGMLDYHIRVVDRLLADVKTARATRYACARLPSFADEETKAADRRVRIERLKAKGWKRERFVPGRYRELCERALAEL